MLSPNSETNKSGYTKIIADIQDPGDDVSDREGVFWPKPPLLNYQFWE